MKKNSKGCLIVLCIIATFILAVFIADKFIPSGAIQKLPSNASEIEEHYQSFGINGDYQRLLRAKIPQEEVEGYAKKLGATNEYNKDNASHFPSSWSRLDPWFAPQDPPLYYFQETGYRILIGWEDGYVYLDVFAW